MDIRVAELQPATVAESVYDKLSACRDNLRGCPTLMAGDPQVALVAAQHLHGRGIGVRQALSLSGQPERLSYTNGRRSAGSTRRRAAPARSRNRCTTSSQLVGTTS